MAATVPTGRIKPGKNSAKTVRNLPVADTTIEGLAEMFKRLADKSRLKILLGLARDGEMDVTSLCRLVGQSQPAVSHHLHLLRMARLVGFRRDGKHNYYRVDCNLVRDLLDQFFSGTGDGDRQIKIGEFALAYKRSK